MAHGEIRASSWTSMVEDQGSADAAEVGDDFSRECARCWQAIFRYAISQVDDPQNAEDLVADTFERALRAWPSFERRSPALTWFIGIARHVIANHHRRVACRTISLETVRRDLPLQSVSAEDAAEKCAADEELQRAIQRLTENDRELLALRFAVDLSFRQISRLLGQREVTVRVRTHRALRRLRSLLEEVSE
jgi:RNA polymerase sigma-70 factor (ECF subfamily)